MTTTADDLFEDAEAPPKYGFTPDQAYYKFPPPPGVEVPKGWRGWKRMTNLVGAFSDQRALQLWLERQTLLGLLANDGTVFDELAASGVEHLSPDEQRDMLEKFAQAARDAVGADTAARRGTARHTMLETYLTHGRQSGHRRMQMQMESLLEAMELHELDFIPGWSERKVWHPSGGGTMGTMDARVMCRRTGQVGILDLKTQARFWTYQEICGQQYGYDSAPWAWEGPPDDTGHWAVNPGNDLLGVSEDLAGKRVALLAHMPQAPGPGQLPVQIHEVDLEYGKRVLDTAAVITELRSRGKSVSAGRRVGGIRPVSGVARPA